MYMEAGVSGQPRPHLGVLMGGVVVDHQMTVQSRRHLLVDQPQEGQVILMGRRLAQRAITSPVVTCRAAHRVVVPWRM